MSLTLPPPTRWQPTLHATQAPAPPPVDARIEDEAAATAAAQAAGYEGRRIRRFMQRRTVDYHPGMVRWGLRRATATCVRDDKFLLPSAHHIVDLLPPAAYAESSQAVTTNLVHTSTNKIRCPVNVCQWTPEGRRLLTGSQSGEFTLWNGLTFNFETILQAHDHPIRALLYSKSGTWILSADQGGVVKYFQNNMNNIHAIPAHREAVRGLSFSPDDSRFVTASDDSSLKIFAFDEAREEKTLKGHGWDAKCVAWHPYKGLIVSGSKDNLLKFWDPRSGGNLATFHGHKNTVQAVKWSLDGHLVASASTDQTIKLYDIRSMAELYTLKGHQKEACSLDWHPSHPDLLVSGGGEGSMHFWSLKASDPTVPVHSMETAHDSNIWSMAWHPLGHVLASGSNDHTTRFWERARPEDGRREEGDSAGLEKAARWKSAAKGGEEWDDDFIPGLNSNRRVPPPRGDGSGVPSRAPLPPSHGGGFNGAPANGGMGGGGGSGGPGAGFAPRMPSYGNGSGAATPGFGGAGAPMPLGIHNHNGPSAIKQEVPPPRWDGGAGGAAGSGRAPLPIAHQQMGFAGGPPPQQQQWNAPPGFQQQQQPPGFQHQQQQGGYGGPPPPQQQVQGQQGMQQQYPSLGPPPPQARGAGPMRRWGAGG